MMENTVYRKNYAPPQFCEKEILRYARSRKDAEDVIALERACVEEVKDKLTYNVCYREFEIDVCGDLCDLGFTKVNSKALSKNLSDCGSVIIFAATIGIEIDRLIARYGKVSPAKGLMFQAIGAERIEALCDEFCRDMEEEKSKQGFHLRPRFSPGYGDLPLNMQRDIFSALECYKQIGLTLNDSMLMSPSKSVTAIIGITKNGVERSNNKCSLCSEKDCIFRSI